MDPIIRTRLVKEITVFPYDKIVRGNKTFGNSYKLNAYIKYSSVLVQNLAGNTEYTGHVLYIDVLPITKRNVKTITQIGSEIIEENYLSLEDDGYIYSPTHIGGLDWKPFNVGRSELRGSDRLFPVEPEATYETFRLHKSQLNGQFVLGPYKNVVQFTNIKKNDEIEFPELNQRIAVKEVRAYQGLGTNSIELVEVLM